MATYNFATGKWDFAPAQQPAVTVAKPAPLPSLNVTTKPNSTPGNLQGTASPQVTAPATVIKPKTYNPQPAAQATVVQPAGRAVASVPTPAVPSQPKQLDLNALQKLTVSGVDGSAPPVPPGPARQNTSAVDLVHQNIPRTGSTWKDPLGSIFQPLGRAATSLISGPLEMLKNFTELGYINKELNDQVARGEMPYSALENQDIYNKTNRQLVGESALAVLDVYMPNVGKQLIIKSLGKEGAGVVVKELLKQGAKEGFVNGLPYGVALAESAGITDPKEYAKIVIASTAVSTGLGTLISGGIPLVEQSIVNHLKIRDEFKDALIKKGVAPYRAEQLAQQGGFIGDWFKNPKIQELEAHYQRVATARGQATSKTSVKQFDKALAKIESDLKREYQGGFVKNPFVKDTPTPKELAKPALPELKSKEPGIFKKLYQALKPIKGADEEVQQFYKSWADTQVAAKEAAQNESKKLSNIPGQTGMLSKGKGKEGWQTILDYEAGKATPYSNDIQQVFDNLHDEAKAAGFDVPYRQNYVPQMYKNSPEEITQAVAKYMQDEGVSLDVIMDYMNGKDLPTEMANRLKLNPNFIKQRVFPDYATATKYGLSPRFTHPSQLAASYKQGLEEAISNRQLVSDLTTSGQLSKRSRPGYSVVDWPFLGEPMYAKNNLATALNGVFANQEGASAAAKFGKKVVSGGASASKFLQELVLSAGIPKSNINFFAIGQLIKQVTSRTGEALLHPLSATKGLAKDIAAFARANIDSKSIKFFEKKAPIIQKMADNGIDLSSRVGNFADMYKNIAKGDGFVKALGKGWDKTFSEKTFASFMPQLYVNTFEATYQKALRQGMDDKIASDLAAKTTRAFYGLAENNARSKVTQDALSTAFFAPRFRESIINALINTGKSVTTGIFDKSLAKNRQLLTGMALTFGAYQALNKKLNGHYTWDNESGKEFSLRVPLPDGKNVMYVDFMPSFLTVPRNLVTGAMALARGDTKTASQKASAFLSQPINILSQILGNQDYFGRPIYKDTDDAVTKYKKIGTYLGLEVNHPYLKLVADYLDNKDPENAFPKPLTQSLVEALEFPLKFNSLDRISRQEFYEAVEKKEKESADVRKSVQPMFDKVQSLKDQGLTKEQVEQQVGSFANLSDEQKKAYQSLKATNTRSSNMDVKSKMYSMYQQVQELKSQGKSKAEVEEIVGSFDTLSKEEKDAYNSLKKQFTTYDENGNQVKSYRSETPFAEPISLNTGTLDKANPDGKTFGQCGDFVKTLVSLPTPSGRVGQLWTEKKDFVDDYGMKAKEWRANGPQVGDIVYINTGQAYGHVAFIKEVNENNGTIKLKEANWGEDEKIGTRTININNPNIYGAIRGTVKNKYASEVQPLPQLSTKSSASSKQPVNADEFAKALSLL